jgi:hypothetical protein
VEEEREPAKVVYSERHVFWTLLVLMLLLLAVYITVSIGAGAKRNWSTTVMFGVLAVLFGAVTLNFASLVFVVTEREVVFGFGLIKKRIARERIESCSPYELKFANYLGYGIRIGMDSTVAYNIRNGPGVKIVVDGMKRPYVISVDNPPHICDLLSAK